MACQFCLTGKLGLAANLSAAQIVEQLVEARRLQVGACWRHGMRISLSTLVTW